MAFGTLLASGATLLCCVLPAVLVSIGAGATLVTLISAMPQLVWLSERKGLVFGIAGALLLGSGILIGRARALPCPVEPLAALACKRLRRTSSAVYVVALTAFVIGAVFAYLLPALTAD